MDWKQQEVIAQATQFFSLSLPFQENRLNDFDQCFV
jgi:hypothetical protein